MEILNFLLRPIGNRVFDSCHSAQNLKWSFCLRFWFHFEAAHIQLYFIYIFQYLRSPAIFFLPVYLVFWIFYDFFNKRVRYGRLAITLRGTVPVGSVAWQNETRFWIQHIEAFQLVCQLRISIFGTMGNHWHIMVMPLTLYSAIDSVWYHSHFTVPLTLYWYHLHIFGTIATLLVPSIVPLTHYSIIDTLRIIGTQNVSTASYMCQWYQRWYQWSVNGTVKCEWY